MNNFPYDPSDDDLIAVAITVDRICDSFESSWKQGRPPEIESYLNETAGKTQSIIFAELIRLDIHYRSLNGNLTSLDEYQSRFPQYSEILQDFSSQLADSHQQIRRIGRYRLEKIVGQGAFGVVWKAWDEELQRIVAVKIPRNQSLSEQERNRFFREARSAARLSHPGIVSIYDFEEIDGSPILVTEYIQGSTLRDWTRHHEVDFIAAATICRDLASALHAAHQESVIHRDLKPNNVLITEDGQVRITDFGLAKRCDVESTIAVAGAIMGTFSYMSPEQADGKASSVDGRCDIYALGIILYEFLANRVPFKGSTSQQMISQILHTEPVPPHKWNASVPRDLETICLIAMSKFVGDRYNTASELAADLQRFIEDKPITARRLSPQEKLWRWVKRNRLLSAACTLICLLLLSGMTAMLVMHDDGKWQVNVHTDPPDARILVYPRDPISGEPDTNIIYEADGTTPNALRLAPGEYYVVAILEGTPRFHHVFRKVPPRGAEIPIGSTKNRFWQNTGPDTIDWPEIIIPSQTVLDDMVLVKGNQITIPDLYVSTRVFTNRDFLKIRPGMIQSPPDEPYYPKGQDVAIHFAEEAGARLMTANEYEYVIASLPLYPELQNFLHTGKEWTSSLATPEQIENSSTALELNPEFRTSELIGLAVFRDDHPNQGSDKLNKNQSDSYKVKTAIRYGGSAKIGFRLVRPASLTTQIEQPTEK
ncbi:Serine/threonine-protein kinase PrkC [Gimesia maris]|uniref:serine/threonine protein kinase n=1 Tax=Gimesia maris TaxID=122 RepID=UPI001187B686|nr:serine/threonine-protein kinase [Gimesia maris]QDT79648.1 Serine/threonine-protein kinase PrkC [Gimesia maris]